MQFRRLDSVRGFAAFYVCLGHILLAKYKHSSAVLDFSLRFGQEAVMVFFVLSGFVISWSSERRSPTIGREPFKHYFLKRFVRIYSVWFLAVLALATISFCESDGFWTQPLGRVIGNLFMLQDFSSAKPAVICYAIYGDNPLWSLHYEWWFYMLFPAVMILRNRETRMHVVGILAACGAISYVIIPNPISRILMYFSIWWVGVHAASCMRNSGRLILRDVAWPIVYVVASSLPLLVLCVVHYRRGEHLTLGNHPVLEVRHLLSSVCLVLIGFAWRSCNWIGFSITLGSFHLLAPISFSLYVIHYRSIAHATYFSFLQSPILEFAFYAIVTVAFCCISELLVFPWLRAKCVPYMKPAVKGVDAKLPIENAVGCS